MQINQLTPLYSVAAQIAESDFVSVAAAGFKTVICNRPDSEVETGLHAQFMQAEAERLGLTFIHNPVSKLGPNRANLTAQSEAIEQASGPVFAYCRSGTRSTIVWALINAGEMPVDDIVAAAAHAGYSLDNLRPQIEAFAARVKLTRD